MASGVSVVRGSRIAVWAAVAPDDSRTAPWAVRCPWSGRRSIFVAGHTVSKAAALGSSPSYGHMDHRSLGLGTRLVDACLFDAQLRHEHRGGRGLGRPDAPGGRRTCHYRYRMADGPTGPR